MINACIDDLRQRVLAAKKLHSIAELARDMDLTRTTLTAFLRGEYVGLASLLAIEAWLERQKETRKPQTVNTQEAP